VPDHRIVSLVLEHHDHDVVGPRHRRCRPCLVGQGIRGDQGARARESDRGVDGDGGERKVRNPVKSVIAQIRAGRFATA
jgi:hypothetical protein